MPKRSPRLRFVRAAIWLLYLGVLLGLAEAATRALGLVPPHTPQPELAITLYYEDPNGLVQMRPGARYYTNGDVPMIISADGLRDRQYERARQPGVPRVAVVGDSFTMGDGVVVEDSYPDQLERLFADDGREVEVINFGISATNTLQQLEIVRATVLPYAPDVVVLGFNLNDYKVYDATTFERMRRTFGTTYEVNPDRTVRISPLPRTRLEHLKNALATHSALVRLAIAARDAVTGPGDAGGGGDPLTTALLTRREVPAERWDRVNAAVADMADLVRSHDARFLVMILPAMTELPRPYPASFADYPYTSLHGRIEAVLAGAGIDSFDVLPSFEGQAVDSLVVSRFDPHLNRKGNAVVARALHDYLTERDMIEWQHP